MLKIIQIKINIFYWFKIVPRIKSFFEDLLKEVMKNFAKLTKLQENKALIKSKYLSAEEIYKKTISIKKIPTAVEISKMFNGFSSIRYIERNEKIVQFLKTNNVTLNTANYSMLFKGYADTKNLEKVKEIYEFLKEKKQLNPILYSILIDCYSRRGEMEDAEKYFEEMLSNSYLPAIPVFGSMLFGYSKGKLSTVFPFFF